MNHMAADHSQHEPVGPDDMAVVNRATGRAWSVLGRLTGGISDSVQLLGYGRARAVLKIKNGAWWAGQLERTAEFVDTLRANGYPTPPVLGFGPLGGDWFYLATEFVPGFQPAGLDAGLAHDVLSAVDLHATVHPPELRDWSTMITLFLNGGIAELRFPPRLAGLADRALDLVPRPVPALPSGDFVHGDFTTRNLLARGPRLSAVIDVEGFGRGTRTIDLVSMLVSAVAPGTRTITDLVLERAVAASDEQTFRACLAHRVLTRLLTAAERPEDLEGAADQADRVLAMVT
jgi:Ser/Thr protein kinase RdoA (MazF antagonist)